VGSYCEILARELGFDENAARMLGLAAQLHDVGKIGLPDSVLLKQGKLTPAEYDVVKRHCDIGLAIVRPMDGANSHLLLDMAARIAHCHHERWDGTGYPRGLAGAAIPIEARITSVADVFDALSRSRPYKPAFPIERCMAMLEEGRNTQFDPAVLDAIVRRSDDVIEIASKRAD
jgi:putative two-component system response regulator